MISDGISPGRLSDAAHSRISPFFSVIHFSQVDIAGPAGAIVSNADDMTHWLQFNLRGGRAPSGESLISPGRLEETYSEQMAAPSPMSDRDLKRPKYPVSDIHAAYDLGWMTNYYRGKIYACICVDRSVF